MTFYIAIIVYLLGVTLTFSEEKPPNPTPADYSATLITALIWPLAALAILIYDIYTAVR